MKFYLRLFFTIHLIVLSALLFSQRSRPTISKAPAWITVNEINYSKTALDKSAADGYIDVSYEAQVSLADQSRYYRNVKKMISQAGVQNGSEVAVTFDPLYEQLAFHTVKIVRNGETINKLQLSNIKIVHQEKELNNFIYNGSLNAVLILEDVRQGDILEYSYTIKGFNPIFKNKYSGEFNMNFSVPLYQVYYKLIVPDGRRMNIKYLNQRPSATQSTVNGQQVYEWRINDLQPVVLQDYLPSWYNPYAQVLVSEFNSWKEVNDWARDLFPSNRTLSAPLQKKIKEIETSYATAEERTKASLQFVQDEIRYMGIEMGENSHKPADPSKVFAQRFGDCKEKSYLLCCMLNAMHIEASPVLINTVVKKSLNALLPAPTNFDHVTVRVKLDKDVYWFDATIANQRGDLKDIFYPDYQSGLVVTDSTRDLTTIPFRNTSSVFVKEYFKVGAMSGGGRLIVTSIFKGGEADDTRAAFKNESISDKMISYQKFYATYYPDIKADSLNYTDDDSTGIFTTTEYYSLPDFWTVSKTKVSKFSFFSFIIDGVIRKPKEKNRTMPFSLIYPAKYREEITIELPDEWKVTEDETELKNKNFNFSSRFYCTYNMVHLNTDYENYNDYTDPEEAAAYFKELKEYDELNFQVTSGVDASDKADSKGSASSIFSIILLGSALAGGVIWWGKRK